MAFNGIYKKFTIKNCVFWLAFYYSSQRTKIDHNHEGPKTKLMIIPQWWNIYSKFLDRFLTSFPWIYVLCCDYNVYVY